MKAVSFNRVGLEIVGKRLFSGVSLSVPCGSFCIITGQSGCGKTSLLKMIYLDQPPTWGSLSVLEADVGKVKDKTKMRKEIGVIFQDFKLLNEYSILENVMLPLTIRGLAKKDAELKSREILKWVGISNVDNYVSVLSSGEKQRVAIARAIIFQPKLLIADEPVSSLDQKNADEIMRLLNALHKDMNMTIIMSSHDTNLLNKVDNPFHIKIENYTLKIA